ncbi:MAG: hypothetical protein BAJALOKI1v1_380021 [Promethearchaeota archaeon]|nr:MAG: hypothetical protein BAJALOKI1v1_380021 [Candidatus Lokiarchaeota archaeon]
MNEEKQEHIIENYISPDAIVDYLFIEKVEEQHKLINDDQGYQMGFFNLFFTGSTKNYELNIFKKQLAEELDTSLKTYDRFQNTHFIIEHYKFGFVDNDKQISLFREMDEEFFEYFKRTLRNLLIIGQNFDIERFQHHEIFNYWFDEYSNSVLRIKLRGG